MKELNKINKKLSKKIRAKENAKATKCAMNNLRKHITWLEKDGWYAIGNYSHFLPTRPYFSMLHSLKSGLSILLYTRTHLSKNDAQMKLHRCNAVRVQIPPNMMIIIHEGLYYADAKTRKVPNLPWVEHDTH